MSKKAITICEKTIIPKTTSERFLPLSSPGGRLLSQQGVLLAGITTAHRGFEIGRVSPPFHTLLFTLEGSGLLITPTEEIPLRPNDLVVGPAGHVGHIHLCKDEYWKSFFFRLADTSLWSELRRKDVLVSTKHTTSDLAFVMDRFIAESLPQRCDSAVITNLYAELILLFLQREVSSLGLIRYRELRERLDRLWDGVNASLGEHWTADRLAKEAGLSKSHFTRTCLRFYKRTPMQMLTSLRMIRAQVLLSRTDWPIYRIADFLGYSNQYAFSVAFSRYSGDCPRNFRLKPEDPYPR